MTNNPPPAAAPAECAFLKHKPIQSPRPATPFFRLSHSWPLSVCSSHPRTGYQTTRDTSPPQSPLKSFKLANPQPACLASSLPSLGDCNKASCHRHPPLSLCLCPSRHLPMWPLVVLVCVYVRGRLTSCLFNHSHFLTCWPCLPHIIYQYTRKQREGIFLIQ